MKIRFQPFLGTLAVIALGAASPGYAGLTWDGGGGDTNINTQNNWNDDLNPTLTGGTSSLIFGTGGSTATINTATNVLGITLNRDANFELANGTGSLTIGTGGITMTLPTTTARTHTISESNLVLGGNQTWAVTNNTGLAQLNVSSAIDDGASTFAITKTGTGTLVLSGDNSFGASGSNGLILGNNTNTSGSPTDFGVIRLAHNNAAGLGRIVVYGGHQDSQLEFSNNITVANRIELYGRQGFVNRVALSNHSGNNTFSGDLNISANGSSINIESQSGHLLISGSTPTGSSGRVLTLLGNGDGEFAKKITTAVFGEVRKISGTGTWAISGDNDYAGATTISAGAINIRHANALGTTVGGTSVSSGAALQLQGGITTAAESLSLTGTGLSDTGALRNISGTNTYSGAITLAGATRIHADDGSSLTLDVASGAAITGVNRNLTMSGAGNITVNDAIETGTGTLTKEGAGTLTLSATNSYTGATTVSGGTLFINGNISTSATTVQDGGRLGGSGIVGEVNVATGGILAPGNSAGTMTFNGDLTLGLNSISDFEISAFTSGSYDLALAQPAGTQSVHFNSGILNLLFQSGFNTNGSVKIFDFDAYAGDFSAVNFSGLADGFSATFNSTNGVVTVVPEPSSSLLLGGFGVLALLRRRRAC